MQKDLISGHTAVEAEAKLVQVSLELGASAMGSGQQKGFQIADSVDRPEPDGQRQMGAVYDSSGGNGGLTAAGTALKSVPSPNRIVFRAAAYRADESIRKAKPKQFRSASILGAVKCTKFLECDLNRPCHDNVPLFLGLLSHTCCPIHWTFTRFGGRLSSVDKHILY